MFLLNDALIVCALVKENRQTWRADKNSQPRGREAWREELLLCALGFHCTEDWKQLGGL